MMKKAIFFDFDGVIAPSFDIALEVNRLARPTVGAEDYRALFNGPILEAQFDEQPVIDIDFFKEYGERFLKLDIDESVREGIVLLAETHRLFIVSSTPNSIIDEYLRRHDIRNAFVELCGFDVDPSKVKKCGMLCNKYDLNPQEVTFVTDTVGDINEAREADIGRTVAILGGFQGEGTLAAAKPDAVAKDFNSLVQLFSGS